MEALRPDVFPALEAVWQRKLALLQCGLDDAHVSVWEWLFRDAGYEFGRLQRVSQPTIGDDLKRSKRAVGTTLEVLESFGLLVVEDTVLGRFGYKEIRLLDPLDVLVERLRVVHSRGEQSRTRPLFPDVDERDFGVVASDEEEFNAQVSARRAAHWSEESSQSAGQRAETCAFPATSGSEERFNAQVSARRPAHWDKPSSAEQAGQGIAGQLPSDGCAAPEDDRLPALLAAVRAHIGSERFDVWLGRSRFYINDLRLVCVCESEWFVTRAQRLTQQINTVLLTIDETLRWRVELEPPDKIQSAGQRAETCALKVQEASSFTSEPLQGSEVKEKNKQSQAAPSSDPERRGSDGASKGENPQGTLTNEQLLAEAARLHRLIDDDSTYRWLAIEAVLAMERGQITREKIRECVRRGPFGRELKRALGKLYVGEFALKRQLAARGIKWRKHWRKGGFSFDPQRG